MKAIDYKDLRNDFFFQKQNSEKKQGFDSYSKNVDDISNFYRLKYPEISPKFKRRKPFNNDEIELIKQKSHLSIDTAFEAYILAFLNAFSNDFNAAIDNFSYCIELLDESYSSTVNRIFIKLQIAQLEERLGNQKNALRELKNVYTLINKSKDLILEINNFYASCCISIGLIFFRNYNNNNLAGSFFSQSIDLRYKYRHNYPQYVYENYLSTAYRYKAVTYHENGVNKYLLFKASYELRNFLLGKTNDQFTKIEFIHLSFDFIIYLISSSYNKKIVNKLSNKMFKVINEINYESRKSIGRDIFKYSGVLSKFYFINNDFIFFFKWYALSKKLKNDFKIATDVSFLDSEDVYQMMKN